MSELEQLRDHARERLAWNPGPPRAACSERTPLRTPKPPDHVNCGGHRCGCECHRPSDRERHLWTQIANEIDAHLSPDNEGPDLFGGVA